MRQGHEGAGCTDFIDARPTVASLSCQVMKRNAYVLLFDGFADWEAALAMCEINGGQRYRVVTVGFSREPVVSAGGLNVTPDVALSEIRPAETAIFIVPGGEMWESFEDERFFRLLRALHASAVPLAAICSGTLAVARAGLLNTRRHTSNALDYLKAHVPGYAGEGAYVNELAVSDGGIITASGVGSVEFAREIIGLLEIYESGDLAVWFDLFKHGILPEPHAV